MSAITKALKFAKDHKAEVVDLKFVDMLGAWQHFTIPAHRLDKDLFEDGLGFDGSSIRGWQAINESDMLFVPDPTTMKMDPFSNIPCISFICNIFDPLTKQPYSKDPRYVAQKADAYLKSTGIADTAFFGPEAEFFIFDDVRFDLKPQSTFFSVDSREGAWNSGKNEQPNLGFKIDMKGGYAPVAPHDSLWGLRNEMSQTLEEAGIGVDIHHHEVGTAGQSEIGIRFAPMLEMADKLQWFKYIVRNVANRNQKVATFMPKPIYGDNGSGMHMHMSLWKDGNPLFAGDKYAGMSDMALHYIAGVLEHAPALLAFTNPTTNSYRRLVPGYEAPIKLAYSSRNRSAAIRIPTYGTSPASKRFEFRTPDPSCNGYLAFAAVLLAGLDGIERQLDPGAAMDKDIYSLPPEELQNIPSVPGSLEESLEALADDHQFLTKGDVFTEDLIHSWVNYKVDHEILPAKLRPTPLEYQMYFNG